MNIRKFVDTDKKQFLSMCDDFYHCGAANEPIELSQMQDTFNYAVTDGNHLIGLTLEHDGNIAGYGLAFLYYSNEAGGLVAFLDEIYVKPEFRSEGIGKQYLQDIADFLSSDEQKIIGLRLEVCYDNSRALKLYEEIGFNTLEYKQMIMPTLAQ